MLRLACQCAADAQHNTASVRVHARNTLILVHAPKQASDLDYAINDTFMNCVQAKSAELKLLQRLDALKVSLCV